MKLAELCHNIMGKFHIDDYIETYLSEDKGILEVVEVTEPCYDDEGKLLTNEFKGRLLTLYLRDGIITSIEPNALSIITPVNKELYDYILSLMYQPIDDIMEEVVLTKTWNRGN